MNDFAIFGGSPEFAQPLPFGQLYFPSWERYQDAFRGIFDRQYYTEYGPLNQQLELKLKTFLGVKHAICVTNETIGLMMLASAMELKGKIILPKYASIVSVQALIWAGLAPIFCEIDPESHQIESAKIAQLIDKDVSAVMGVHLWGGASDVKALDEIAASHGLQLFFDAAHSFGCSVNGVRIGNFGCAEVLSFHESNILNATEGGCICTNDDELAARLRTMRSSAGAGKPVEVTKTVNGRMTEAQSAIALMNLDDFLANQQNNENLYQHYDRMLAGIPGLHLIKPGRVSFSNYQSVVCRIYEEEFGLPADMLISLLKSENVNVQRFFIPAIHYGAPEFQDKSQYSDRQPIADNLSTNYIQFPTGALVNKQVVERICNILGKAHLASARIREMIS